jgi:nitrite reductase/ring-hydroxylating ferredoxin subunit
MVVNRVRNVENGRRPIDERLKCWLPLRSSMVRAELTTVGTVYEEGSWLFTVADDHGNEEEVLLVPCEGGVEAWVNKCTHEFQRLDRGFGSPIRDGEILCPKHGSTFDTCSGYCDNGEAAETTLVDVSVEIESHATSERVFLSDESYTFRHEGPIDDGDDDMPSPTSHLSF